MVKKKSGLGKGMESLIPTEVVAADFDPSAGGDSAVRTKHIHIETIIPNRSQPRKDFVESALAELVASITEHGILQPLIVSQSGDKFELIAGERRWRAAKKAGLERVPVIIRSPGDQDRLELAIIENVQREDLSALEAAAAYDRLNRDFNATWEKIAKRIGKNPSTIVNVSRLMKLSDAAKQALNKGSITEGHARAILAVKNKARQAELLELILNNKWTVREAEQFVKGVKGGAKSSEKAAQQTATETTETKELSKQLKTKIRIHNMAKGGRIIIDYKDDKDLKRISKRLLK